MRTAGQTDAFTLRRHVDRPPPYDSRSICSRLHLLPCDHNQLYALLTYQKFVLRCSSQSVDRVLIEKLAVAERVWKISVSPSLCSYFVSYSTVELFLSYTQPSTLSKNGSACAEIGNSDAVT